MARIDRGEHLRTVRLLLEEVMAEHRENGAEAAARAWRAASTAARAEAGRRLFVMTCGASESGKAALTAEQTRNLSRQLIS